MMRLYSIAFLCVWLLTPAYAGGKPNAQDMLRRVFSRKFTESFVQVAIINNSETGGEPVTMRIDSTNDGWMRYTCIQPASSAGIVSIDDGKTWKQYEPDKGSFMSVPSNRAYTLSLDDRIKLIADNYRLAVSASSKIAGVDTFRIDASPRRGDLPERTFWLERRTYAPLRYIMNDGVVVRKVLLDTIKFELQKVQRSSAPKRSDGKNWKLEKMDIPVPLRTVDDGIRRLKMSVKFPKKLPLGFRVQNVQVVGDDAARLLSIRMTDGLSFATLYMSTNSRKNSVPSASDHVIGFTAHGVNYQLRSDLPTDLAQNLLESILDVSGEKSDRIWNYSSDVLGCVEKSVQIELSLPL